MKLTAITLDCPDPRALAAFYQQAARPSMHLPPGWNCGSRQFRSTSNPARWQAISPAAHRRPNGFAGHMRTG